MLKDKIQSAIVKVIGEIPAGHEIERIKEKKWGDFASNIGFLLKKEREKERLLKELARDKDFSQVKQVGGFFNFTFSLDYLRAGMERASRSGEDFSRGDFGNGKRVIIEFVSANPTGPLSVVQARAGALGQAIANLLAYSGYEVSSEYYVNDAGTQVELLFRSLEERIKELKGEAWEIPPGGYPGEYIKEIASEILALGIEKEKRKEYILTKIIEMQKESLRMFNIHFDKFVRETSILPKVPEVLNILSKKGLTYEKDGARYFSSASFGDSEDRVLVTRDGRYTYFLTDLAYHKDKLERGFDILINIWGPDHHGYIPRMKAGIEALGALPGQLQILIAQQVSLLRGKEKVAMSKRRGEFITLDEVREEIGADTLKFYLLMRKSSQGIQFDLELAKQATKDNPVYYVQYAHARLNSILEFARTKNYKENVREKPPYHLLGDKEREIILGILYFPDVVRMAAESLEPHILVYYLIDLAEEFHNFYEKERVVSEDREKTKARLFLCCILKDIFRKGLNLLGIGAPEKM